MTRKCYSESYKKRCVRDYRKGNQTLKSFAKNRKLNISTLSNWIYDDNFIEKCDDSTLADNTAIVMNQEEKSNTNEVNCSIILRIPSKDIEMEFSKDVSPVVIGEVVKSII